MSRGYTNMGTSQKRTFLPCNSIWMSIKTPVTDVEVCVKTYHYISVFLCFVQALRVYCNKTFKKKKSLLTLVKSNVLVVVMQQMFVKCIHVFSLEM